jgi:hypothetical protein
MSHNRYGYYLRNRVKPTNPSSPRQQEIRTILAECSQRWSGTLTSDQRAGWDVYAANIARYNRIGSTIYLTGHAMYVSCNSARIYAGLDAVDNAPTILTMPEADGSLAAAASEATQKLAITFDDTRDWCSEEDAAMTIQMSMPSGAGTNYNMGPFRHAGVILGNSTPPSSPASLDVPWPVAENQLITVQARIVRADGRLTQPFRDSGRVGP